MKLGATGVLTVVGVALGGFLLWKASGLAKGLLTGDNALTKNATDSNGKPVTAYQGAGPVGTLGAAANVASGGYLATFGSWLGSSTYDFFHTGDGSTSEPVASYDETDRLLKRYPAPLAAGPDSVFNGYTAGTSWGSLAGLDGGSFDSLVQPITGP